MAPPMNADQRRWLSRGQRRSPRMHANERKYEAAASSPFAFIRVHSRPFLFLFSSWGVLALCLSCLVHLAAADEPAGTLLRQTQAEADAKSAGCLTCHSGIEPMHKSEQV